MLHRIPNIKQKTSQARYNPTRFADFNVPRHSVFSIRPNGFPHKVNSLNDKSKAIGRICLKFHISVTSPNTKELPEDSSRPEGKQSTRHGCSLSLRLSRGPNATIVRPDFLCLAVADTGITLDLDKDGHSDSNQNQDADHRKTFSCHNSYTFGCKRFSWGSFISTPPVCQKNDTSVWT